MFYIKQADFAMKLLDWSFYACRQASSPWFPLLESILSMDYFSKRVYLVQGKHYCRMSFIALKNKCQYKWLTHAIYI